MGNYLSVVDKDGKLNYDDDDGMRWVLWLDIDFA